MSTVAGPPPATPPTLRGALATLPSFLRRKLPLVLASAAAAGIIGWVVNVWLLAVKFEGNNDVPPGSPVTGGNNTGAAAIFWVLFSVVAFGVFGYARAVGMRRFMVDVRTTPRVLIGFVRRDGAAARVHILWGAAISLLIGLAVPPAIGAVLSVGLLASLPTVLGAITGSVLGRLMNGVLRPFRPTSTPLGIEAMLVGLLGAGLAIGAGFLVSNKGIRAAAAGACVLGAIVLANQARPKAAAAIMAAAVAGGAVVRWVLSAKHAYADDGGFAECGFELSRWWRQCDGAGEVRRQAVPGGVASAAGAPIGIFLGQWAGTLSRLRPMFAGLGTHPITPPADPLLPPWLLPAPAAAADVRRRWSGRPSPWVAGPDLELRCADGSLARCGTTADGQICTPWIATDPSPSPGAGGGEATDLARRLNALADLAPSPAHRAEVERSFLEAPSRSLDELTQRVRRLEVEHRAAWDDRLRDIAQRARHHPGPVLEARLDGAVAGGAGTDRLGDDVPNAATPTRVSSAHTTSPETVGAGGGPTTRVAEVVVTSFGDVPGGGGPDAGGAGRLGVFGSAHHGAPPSPVLAGAGRTIAHGDGAPGFVDASSRSTEPLGATAARWRDMGDGVVSERAVGVSGDAFGGSTPLRHAAPAPEGDRLGGVSGGAGPADAATRHLDRMLARQQQLEAMARGVERMDAAAGAVWSSVSPVDAHRHHETMLEEVRRLQTMHAAYERQMHGAMGADATTARRVDDLAGVLTGAGGPEMADRMRSEMESIRARLQQLASEQRAMLDAQQREAMIAATEAVRDVARAREVAMSIPWRADELAGAAGVPIDAMRPAMASELERMRMLARQMVEMRSAAADVDAVVAMRQLMEATATGAVPVGEAEVIARQRFGADLMGLVAQAQARAGRR